MTDSFFSTTGAWNDRLQLTLGPATYSLFRLGNLRVDDVYLLATVSEVEHGINEQKSYDTKYSTSC